VAGLRAGARAEDYDSSRLGEGPPGNEAIAAAVAVEDNAAEELRAAVRRTETPQFAVLNSLLCLKSGAR